MAVARKYYGGTILTHNASFEAFTLKMVAAQTSETLVYYYNTIWHHNPKHLNLKL